MNTMTVKPSAAVQTKGLATSLKVIAAKGTEMKCQCGCITTLSTVLVSPLGVEKGLQNSSGESKDYIDYQL